MDPVRLLVVDDEEMVLRAIGRVLRRNSWDVTYCNDPGEAMGLIHSQPWDILMVDYRMPKTNGLELLIEARKTAPDTVRILMTGYTDLDVIIEAINTGNIFKYVAKPWDNDRLQATLEEARVLKQDADNNKVLLKSVLEEKSEWGEIVHSLEHRLIQISNQGVQALLKVIHAKDPELYLHSLKVAWVADRIAEGMDLKDSDRQTLRLAAYFHDIGKIAIRDSVLYKEGKLDAVEREQMRHHAQVSSEILRELDFMEGVAEVVLQHHEKLDGTGYPFGLKGAHIRQEAQILSVADIYVALRERRVYKDEGSSEDSITILYKEAETGISREIVKVLEAMLDEAELPDENFLKGWCVL